MTPENPLVSIVIPTYNRAHLIRETIESIRNQNFSNWECLIIDDRSTDDTEELLRFYQEVDPRIKYWIRPNSYEAGANACRNLGFEYSKGEYIKWLDSDDVLTSEYFDQKIRAFREYSADLVVCNYLLFNSAGKRTQPFNNISSNKDLLWDYISGRININAQSCIWRKEIIEDFRFDTSLKRAQELDFHFRILKEKNINVHFIKENLVLIRNHTESISGNFSKGDLEAIRSDLKVRANILEYIMNVKGKSVEIEGAFKLYLTGIRQLITFKYVKEIYLQFKFLGDRLGLGNAFVVWKIKLVYLLILFNLTDRSFRLQKHISSLKI